MKAKQKRAKRLFQRLFAELTERFNRHDRIGLIAMGAPLDEYQPEVSAVLARLKEAAGSQDVRRILHQEFVRMFTPDLAGLEARFQGLADDVWECWRRFQDELSEG